MISKEHQILIYCHCYFFSFQTTGNIQAVDTSQDGRATFHKEIKNLKLHEIVGRSVVIHEGDLNSLEKGSTVR